jgi:RsiW-degrading membrane proteinase PrsW (M82 family)
MVVCYSNKVLKPLIICQKFDIHGTYMRACVNDERLDLLDFLPDIKGFFQTIGLQNHQHSCSLTDSKCLWTSVFLPMARKILIHVLMFMYNSGRKPKCCLILSIFVGLFVGFLTVMIAIFAGARYV